MIICSSSQQAWDVVLDRGTPRIGTSRRSRAVGAETARDADAPNRRVGVIPGFVSGMLVLILPAAQVAYACTSSPYCSWNSRTTGSPG
jgi:hypothetical protein